MTHARRAPLFGILLGMTAAGLLATFALNAAGAADPPEVREVTLKIRKDNGPYGEAAYSFRQATHDVAVHRNYVDVLLNGCGHLHVRTVTGYESRICDLGKAALEDAPDAPRDDAAWKTESLRPAAGHVYLLEVKDSGQTMTVKFAADEVTDKAVTLRWTTVTPLAGPAPDPNRGRAGTMGQCGGDHESR
jgi:hypothetical protein